MIGMKINLYDQSAITEIAQAEEVDNSPVVLTAMASSKGTEDMFDLKGQTYINMFGEANYKSYGQVSIQNQKMIEAGARLVGKRIVADDANLANITVVAKLYKTEIQKVDVSNAPLYYDADMKETTTVTENPVMIATAHVRYEIVSSTGKTIDQIVELAAAELNTTGEVEGSLTVFSYPLYTITDNGRCVSKKRFSLRPELSLSKNLSFMFYNLTVYENGISLESARFAASPNTVYHSENIELSQVANTYMSQIKAHSYSDNMTLFVTKLSEFSGIEEEILLAGDVLFGASIKGTPYTSIVIDTENGVDLQATTGLALVNGTNGTFGDAPLSGTEAQLAAYNAKLLEFFDGTATPDIYNVDMYQIDASFDANYPKNVKEKIVELANYRKDFMFVRDLGLTNYTIDDIRNSIAALTRSTWTTDFCQAYEVLDSYSKKNVKVSATYTISRLMVDHLKNHRDLPFAGETNEAILTDAIKGTITYLPTVTPSIDEKTELEDLRVNFASYFKDKLIIETLYTSQREYTQLSFSNNCLALQRIFKVLRTAFPATRYQSISNEDDLKTYESRINEVISQYASDFAYLEFKYVQDPVMLSNKIFRAALYFRFKEFTQAESIDAYVLPTNIGSAVTA